MSDREWKLPGDWKITRSVVPLAEVHDWSFAFLGVPELWKEVQGEGVKAALLDTGCDLRHPDLQGAIAAEADFTRSAFGVDDRLGHGTFVAGMIGARANNIGVAGIAPLSQLYIAKVLGDNGSGTEDQIYAGFKWAMQQGVNIISMSLGGPMMSDRLRGLFQEFVSQPGHFIFAAAGNDGQLDSVNCPGIWPETICVGAIDQNGNLARFSSRGPRVDVLCPGVEMLSTIPGGYGTMSGTSMATPEVAGVAALGLAKHLKLGGNTPLDTVETMRARLKKTGRDGGTNTDGVKIIDPAHYFADLDEPHLPPVVPPSDGDGPVGLKLGKWPVRLAIEHLHGRLTLTTWLSTD